MGPFGGLGQKLGGSSLDHLKVVYGCFAKTGEKESQKSGCEETDT